MCGIIYIERKDGINPLKMLHKWYENQKTRGTDGYGFIAIKEGKIVSYARRMYEQGIFDDLDKVSMDTVLFHHRTPTSTPNLPELNHPFFISHDSFKNDYYFVHNGVISNASEVKTDHEKDGITYKTRIESKLFLPSYNYEYPAMSSAFNDSEALAWDFALFQEGLRDRVEARGSIAFVCLEVSKATGKIKLHFARNWGSPLKFIDQKDFFALASEQENAKIVEQDKLHTKEGEMIAEKKLYLYEGWRGYTSGYDVHDEEDDKECYKEKYGANCYCAKCRDKNTLILPASKKLPKEEKEDKEKDKEEDVEVTRENYEALTEYLGELKSDLAKARNDDDYDQEQFLLEEIQDIQDKLLASGFMSVAEASKGMGFNV